MNGKEEANRMSSFGTTLLPLFTVLFQLNSALHHTDRGKSNKLAVVLPFLVTDLDK